MGQTGFFDLERRLDGLSAKGDPLETIKATVPWEAFRAEIEAVTETKPEEKKSNAGRKPYDAILKFKIVVLQSLYNLSCVDDARIARGIWRSACGRVQVMCPAYLCGLETAGPDVIRWSGPNQTTAL